MGAMATESKREKVLCPYCGHPQQIAREAGAQCRGLYIKCRARHCGKVFEIRIEQQKNRPQG